ncbi:MULTISPECIES: sensor histidine kinase [Vibrio]|uniref:sensor histidine kinase n=1 Tax=Vibrio TaxID=662 RepID=UPI0006CA9E46|nr:MULTISPECIES: ATP-binding protein [Vibrio]EGQ8497699.1 PAS domain S-box protein [Vibrio alginolyticus]EHC9868326.1 PAS domain S-box protein [Vibrio alginolyticus]EJS0323741.1 PAS domain S-box protein [Vibrio alginolyticus]ELA7830655.1 PAS domain S-box protein [Vibrio alginolyticus]ELB1499819.1 PAS domain S-box protein [Vibrio alginolyticus]
MQRKRNGKTWLVVAIAAVLMLSCYSASREVARQWLSVQTQTEAQQKLLDYIGEVRRALKRFYHLPYLVTNNPETIAFVKGNLTYYEPLQTQLTQLDKAANTEGWLILSNSGEVLVSSLIEERFSLSDRKAIVEQIHNQGGGVSLVNKTKGSSPLYYLAAPIYDGLDIAGIVVVQINLSLLTEQTITSQDIITLQNRQQRFFLSSSSLYNADWFNEPSNTVQLETQRLYDNTNISVWTLNQQRYFAHTVKLDDLNWYVSYLTPSKPIQQTINVIGWSVAALLLLVVLLVIIGLQRRQKHINQQRIQALLEESQRRLKQMINKTHVGLLLIDEQGQLFDLNPMAKRLFCLPESVNRHAFAWELFDAGNPNSTTLKLLKDLPKHKELAEISTVETIARRSDGSVFPVLFSLTSFPWHGEQYFLATIIDISKRKKAEQSLQQVNQELAQRVEERTQALKEAQSQLIESSKMAALGRMSSAITHELNQPLTGLRTLLTTNELLAERGETEMMKANNVLVQKLIDRMASMTSQLKTFAYNKPESLQAISLTSALEETLRVYQSQLDKVDVRVRVPHDLPNIMGEEQRLLQVLGNLVSNALDAMNNTTNPQLNLIVNPTGNRVELIVSDNGCGVSDEMLESMFEPFQTSKKIGEGLGLGLAITANNMRDMNGQISVHKNEQNGLTFTLLFKSA